MASHSVSNTKAACPGSGRWLTWAYRMWLFLAVAVCIKTLVTPEQHTVFPKFSARAIAWWSGSPLYEPHEGLGRFPYSPTFAVLLTPFAYAGNRFGAMLWSGVNIAVYVWGLDRLTRDVLPGVWPPNRRAAFLMLAMVGAIRGLWNAQSNALIIGLLMGGTSAVARQRWWAAAFLLAGPVYLKIWPVVIPLLVLAMWPRKFGWRFVAAMIAGALLPFLTQPFGTVLSQYRDWSALLAKISPEVVGSYRDAWTVVNLLEVPLAPYVYRAIQLLAAAIALGWCLWLRHAALAWRWRLTLMLAAGASWTMIFGPAVEYNTYVVLAPMVSWGLLVSFETRHWRGLASTAYAMTMILGAGAVERMLTGFLPAARAMLPLGCLVFVLWLALFSRGAIKTCDPHVHPDHQADH